MGSIISTKYSHGQYNHVINLCSHILVLYYSVSHQPAFEKASDECSVFNKALRKGLLTAGKDLEGVIIDSKILIIIY